MDSQYVKFHCNLNHKQDFVEESDKSHKFSFPNWHEFLLEVPDILKVWEWYHQVAIQKPVWLKQDYDHCFPNRLLVCETIVFHDVGQVLSFAIQIDAFTSPVVSCLQVEYALVVYHPEMDDWDSVDEAHNQVIWVESVVRAKNLNTLLSIFVEILLYFDLEFCFLFLGWEQ